MCGIFGILATNGAVPPLVLERATDSLAHRGPDDRGTVVIQANTAPRLEIGLGNRRLAILDLSPLGHQPMQDPETGNWIVYNGEIYNFRELADNWRAKEYALAVSSDTEVLLQAYSRWGEKHVSANCAECLLSRSGTRNGSRLFGLAIPWASSPSTTVPRAKYFLFASELRTLLGTGLIPRRLDRAGLLNYLKFGSLYDPITLIQGVSALQAGHYADWENGQLKDTTYWDLAPHGSASMAASYLAGKRRAERSGN